MSLEGRLILITGSARRIGKSIAAAVARAGADVIIHHNHSQNEAEETKSAIQALDRKAYIIKADLSDHKQTIELMDRAWSIGPLFSLINNASIFDSLTMADTSLHSWNKHLDINLTAPFLLSQAFASKINSDQEGRIINILDWQAFRPGKNHFPYTISKAGLVALTKALAVTLAPNIMVNGLALGAILPPSDSGDTSGILDNVPAARWADLHEVESSIIFLLQGPAYITGEVIHIDGGRHLI